MAHLATERALNTYMYELFATMCILVNGVSECTTYADTQDQIYKELRACEERAEVRFYETLSGFMMADIPFESIVVGCKGGEES